MPPVTLDQLIRHFAPPQVVKIDIEGAEGAAFAAAGALLEACPTMIVEVSEVNADSLSQLLRGQGYRLYDIRAVHNGAEILRAASNTVAIPPHGDPAG